MAALNFSLVCPEILDFFQEEFCPVDLRNSNFILSDLSATTWNLPGIVTAFGDARHGSGKNLADF
jgi:hypothetical protein